MEIIELKGLRVTLDKLVYRCLPKGEAPHPHGFIYFLSIHNDSDVAVTIHARKWVVKHSDGTTLVVEGDKVVGETPHLEPGQRFSYNSWHNIGCESAIAEGAFFGAAADGRKVMTRIPAFHLVTPNATSLRAG